MKLSKADLKLLLESTNCAIHYYQTFLLHDDWDWHMAKKDILSSKRRLNRFIKANEIVRKLLKESK